MLSQTGLYIDIATKQLAPDATEFTPANVLWSDAAEKHRWIQLPAGAQIDRPTWITGSSRSARSSSRSSRSTASASRRASSGASPIPAIARWTTLFGAYVWNDSESEATFMEDGADNMRGTDHDAPAADTCWKCHVGEAGHILGFSALQLGDVSALPLTDASRHDVRGAECGARLSPRELRALPQPERQRVVDSHMVLRLDVGEHDAMATQIYQTTVGVPLEQWIDRGYTTRIVAGDPDKSAVTCG